MIPLESEFNEVFKSKGGRYNNRHSDETLFSWILTNSRILATWMKQSHEHLPEPYIDIIDSNEPNAYVTKSGDRYFIGITYGTVVLFNDIYYRILSNKKVLTDVGDPAKGIDTSKIYSLRLTAMGQLAVTKDYSEHSEPIEDIRVVFEYSAYKDGI